MVKQDANAQWIVAQAVQEALPEVAVQRALRDKALCGDVLIVAIGKSAWQMAVAAWETIPSQRKESLVLTWAHHAREPLPGMKVLEISKAEQAWEMWPYVQATISGFCTTGTVLLLCSRDVSSLCQAVTPLPDAWATLFRKAAPAMHLCLFSSALIEQSDLRLAQQWAKDAKETLCIGSVRMLCRTPAQPGHRPLIFTTVWACTGVELLRLSQTMSRRHGTRKGSMGEAGFHLKGGEVTLWFPVDETAAGLPHRFTADMEVAEQWEVTPLHNVGAMHVEACSGTSAVGTLRLVDNFVVAQQEQNQAVQVLLVLAR